MQPFCGTKWDVGAGSDVIPTSLKRGTLARKLPCAFLVDTRRMFMIRLGIVTCCLSSEHVCVKKHLHVHLMTVRNVTVFALDAVRSSHVVLTSLPEDCSSEFPRRNSELKELSLALVSRCLLPFPTLVFYSLNFNVSFLLLTLSCLHLVSWVITSGKHHHSAFTKAVFSLRRFSVHFRRRCGTHEACRLFLQLSSGGLQCLLMLLLSLS